MADNYVDEQVEKLVAEYEARLAAVTKRAEEAEAQLAAVPAYAAYVAEEDKLDGPYGPGAYMRFDEWLELHGIVPTPPDVLAQRTNIVRPADVAAAARLLLALKGKRKNLKIMVDDTDTGTHAFTVMAYGRGSFGVDLQVVIDNFVSMYGA